MSKIDGIFANNINDYARIQAGNEKDSAPAAKPSEQSSTDRTDRNSSEKNSAKTQYFFISNKHKHRGFEPVDSTPAKPADDKPADSTPADVINGGTTPDEIASGKIESSTTTPTSNPWDLTPEEIATLEKMAQGKQGDQRLISDYCKPPADKQKETEAFTKILIDEATRAKKEIYEKTGEKIDFSDPSPGGNAWFLANNVATGRFMAYAAHSASGDFNQNTVYSQIDAQVDKFVASWLKSNV